MDEQLAGREASIRYITPERGGELSYDGNIETNRSTNPAWMTSTRRRNRYDQFRQSSVAEFRNLEALVLRSIESDAAVRASEFTFDSEIQRINQVLDRVSIQRSDTAGFSIVQKDTVQTTTPADLSSGESELISLAVEILYFSYTCKMEKYRDRDNWLLLDEPDVHLHPDLQNRLMQLLVASMNDASGKILIATHSTAILSSLSALAPDVRVGFKEFQSTRVSFRPSNDSLKSILPMFGAHPLSNVFNQRPPLIVEGEDDERIWQAAVRRSEGRIAVYPCVAGDKQSMAEYEGTAHELISSVYENAKAYSLRDKDDDAYEIDDLGSVRRARLNCRAAENLIVTDDVLSELASDWDTLCAALEKWILDNPTHSRYDDAVAFKNGGWDRRNFNVKNLRIVIVSITGSTKPWEVAVGQSIARLNERRFDGPDSLANYLGQKALQMLRLI